MLDNVETIVVIIVIMSVIILLVLGILTVLCVLYCQKKFGQKVPAFEEETSAPDLKG